MGNFTLNVIARVIFIIVLAFALAFIVLYRQSFFLPVVLVIAMTLVVMSLVRYIRQTTRNLTKLLLTVKQNAFTDSMVTRKLNTDTAEFADVIHGVTAEFARLSMEKELHYQYLNTLNENIGIAILSFDRNGRLLMANPAATKLLLLPRLNELDDLKVIDPSLPATLKNMRSSDREVVRVVLNKEQIHLAMQLKEIVVDGKLIRIFLLQNIQPELESKEVEAWQQLTRVLTHEIMNSVTPISSLTDAVKMLLTKEDGSRLPMSELSDENIDDIHACVETIASRTKGLLNFVNAYKEFSRVPRINMRSFDVSNLINQTAALFNPDFERLTITLKISKPNAAVISNGDEGLIGQVLINLVKNAIEALHRDNGQIKITLTQGERTMISVADNGRGIVASDIENIFVPFFTTKPSGTGIGLSLSRQMMKLHRGTIKVISTPGETVFTIEW
ncbi:MAG TPA: HAMP domain-containing sensor histidine kinase [Chryseosolibacter sp.]|nr:HAMP domain-containing sensor histidine kinase [Chryseosolibacter sp.]